MGGHFPALPEIRYQLNVEKAEWIIYIIDIGQQEHFEMFFTAAKHAGWLPSGESKCQKQVMLCSVLFLLDESKTRCKEGMIVDWTDEERDNAAEEIGYGDFRGTGDGEGETEAARGKRQKRTRH
ncbi:unnamed protein product [Lactuca saligna]|uniref:Uncharacterized protein n=1 Tax=Lactuca saligna TaxID=75948 RepID=A0AA36EDX4_LACSI|nr:unnamed protein product [Lactuca saligna]